MYNEEFFKQLSDYFTSAELVEFLDIPIETILELLQQNTEYIEDNEELLRERINYGV